MLDDLAFRTQFDEHFISCFVGYRKCAGVFWEQVLAALEEKFPDLQVSDIVFFDDIQRNIDVASKYGIQACLFTEIEQFYNDMESK